MRNIFAGNKGGILITCKDDGYAMPYNTIAFNIFEGNDKFGVAVTGLTEDGFPMT